jgi:hypothetical protein
VLDWIIGLFPSFGSWVWRKFFGPRLRLGFLADPASGGVQGDRDQHVFPIVANGDRWQVVFGLVLRNGGKQEARNWRVRLVTLETSTMLGLDKRPDHRSITETRIGSGWQYEVHAAGPSDTLLPHMPVYIAGRHTLKLRRQAQRCLDQILADGRGRACPRGNSTSGTRLDEHDRPLPVAVIDQRGQLLRAAVGFAGCSMPSYDRALWALRSWLYRAKCATAFGAIAIMVSGCATTPVSSSIAKQVPKDRLLAFQQRTPENNATLVVTRDEGFIGSGCYVSFVVNGTHAARFDVAETAQFYVTPGELVLRVGRDPMGQVMCALGQDNWTQRETVLRPGETKFFRLSTDANGRKDIQRGRAAQVRGPGTLARRARPAPGGSARRGTRRSGRRGRHSSKAR